MKDELVRPDRVYQKAAIELIEAAREALSDPVRLLLGSTP